MPPRLNHRKSRGGCLRCKKRKVKCDEKFPSCTWCVDHGTPCTYPQKPPARPQLRELRQGNTKTIPDSSIANNESHDLSLLLSEESPERRRLELAIWHYYIVKVVPLFPYASESEELYIHQTNIPILAISHSCLLNVILALATLHAWTSLKDHAATNGEISFLPVLERLACKRAASFSPLADLEVVHGHYFTLALQDQRHEVGCLGPENADAVAVTAVFINHCAIVHNTVTAANDRSTYEIPLQWLTLANAMASVIAGARPFLTPESTMTLIMRRFSVPDHKSECFEVMNPHDLGQFAYLLDYEANPEESALSEEEKRAYYYEVWFVEYLRAYIETTHSWHGLSRRFFACITLMPDQFLEFLRQKRPRALAILAHILAMTSPLHDHWWEFRHVGEINVRRIADLVPPEWQDAMAWPLRVLDGVVLQTFEPSSE